MKRETFVAELRAELRRIGLNPDELPALAVQGDLARVLVHLRSLPAGSSWAAAFPGEADDWSPGTPEPECALGPFDYQSPPRGIAVFASLEPKAPVQALDAAIRHARALGYPIYGAGAVLDRGHPHLYVVLPLGATEDDADAIADALRDRDGIANAFPIVRGRSAGDA
jgi:hypothetical protein